jgi:hypothetical protein
VAHPKPSAEKLRRTTAGLTYPGLIIDNLTRRFAAHAAYTSRIMTNLIPLYG